MKEKEIKRAGVIDIGTHSVRLLIAEESESGIKILESLKNLVPIGKDTFFNGHISQETINRVVSILEKYSEKLKENAVSDVRTIATTAVREANNRELFVDTVLRRTGFSIEVLNVGDVVYYIAAYLHHKLEDKYPLNTKNLLIAELGAGSLDISVMAQGYILMSIGLPLGTMRLRQLLSKLDGSLHENYEVIEESIESEFSYLRRNLPAGSIDDIILIDETHAPHLSGILSGKKSKDELFQLKGSDTQDLVKNLIDKNAEDIAEVYKLPVEVAGTLPGYAIILKCFTSIVETENVYVLEASLSEAILTGMILDYEMSQKYNKTNQLIAMANALCRKYNSDLNHVRQVADLSSTLFDGFKEILGLKKTDAMYLMLAAYLHDIGAFIYNRAHHKHAEYIISNLNLFRLTEEEVKIIACVARYHRKGAPNATHLLYQSLAKDKQILVQKLSAILRISNSLDRSHRQKVKNLEIKCTGSQDIVMTVSVEGNFLLEKMDFVDKKNAFEEISGNKVNLKIQSAQ